jgi:hypothetical protein
MISSQQKIENPSVFFALAMCSENKVSDSEEK